MDSSSTPRSHRSKTLFSYVLLLTANANKRKQRLLCPVSTFWGTDHPLVYCRYSFFDLSRDQGTYRANSSSRDFLVKTYTPNGKNLQTSSFSKGSDSE